MSMQREQDHAAIGNHNDRLANRYGFEFSAKVRCRTDLPANRRAGRFAWTRLGSVPARRARRTQHAPERLDSIQLSTAKPLHWFSHGRWRSKLCRIADLPRNRQAGHGAARKIQDRDCWQPLIVSASRTQQSEDACCNAGD
jgi:hypothetical protein